MPDQDIYRPETGNGEARRAVLIITDNGTEDLEFFYPYYRFIEAGYKVDVATPDGRMFAGKHGLGLKESKKIKDMKEENYVLLYLPGGQAPASLKNNLDVLAITRSFAAKEKPIAAICHGPQILAAAGVIDKRKLAAWPEVKDEVVTAGAVFVDKETLTDGPFITARWPGDLPAFMKETLKYLERKKDARSNIAA
ncbi:MAG: DJ-1/PfpI/YhbO family deglycase/protease [Bdellovibrionales bacterium]